MITHTPSDDQHVDQVLASKALREQWPRQRFAVRHDRRTSLICYVDGPGSPTGVEVLAVARGACTPGSSINLSVDVAPDPVSVTAAIIDEWQKTLPSPPTSKDLATAGWEASCLRLGTRRERLDPDVAAFAAAVLAFAHISEEDYFQHLIHNCLHSLTDDIARQVIGHGDVLAAAAGYVL